MTREELDFIRAAQALLRCKRASKEGVGLKLDAAYALDNFNAIRNAARTDLQGVALEMIKQMVPVKRDPGALVRGLRASV